MDNAMEFIQDEAARLREILTARETVIGAMVEQVRARDVMLVERNAEIEKFRVGWGIEREEVERLRILLAERDAEIAWLRGSLDRQNAELIAIIRNIKQD